MVKEKVLIFYSSETEPKILDFYGTAVSYLKQLKADVYIVDVARHPEVAQKNNITATPTLLVKKGSEITEYFGIVDGMKEILRKDIFGKTLIHGMSYKVGRTFVEREDMKSSEEEIIEEKVTNELDMIKNFKILRMDRKKKVAEVCFECKDDFLIEKIPTDIAPFLGGMFMEIFRKPVYAEQKKCKQKKKFEFVIR